MKQPSGFMHEVLKPVEATRQTTAQKYDEAALYLALEQLIGSISNDLNNVVGRYLSSGAIDTESYAENEVLLAKILLRAALADEMAAFSVPESAMKEVRNLQYF